MKKILNYFLRLLKRFRKRTFVNLPVTVTTEAPNIPSEISDSEKISRFIFSPINVNPNTGKLKSNCYKPPAGYDEISVNRLDFTNANFLKKIAIKMQNTNRNYFGFAVINALDIRKSDSDIIYTPKTESTDYNPYHSDIKIGYTVITGEELPAEISNKIQKLVKSTRLYKDNNPELSNWTGDELL
ncbi:hypothetical protein ACSV4D_03675 [Flavobacterium sp. ARAG 55.4]|uniref:hypothetical protein n=1 Tax=Flavobacterium sp. ARAG 55.4 TaxID=3451357 RepID=UPI003F48CC3D